MKRRIAILFILVCLTVSMIGCDKTEKPSLSKKSTEVEAFNNRQNTVENIDKETEESQEDVTMEEENTSDTVVKEESTSDKTEIDMISLPETIRGQKAETEPNLDLQHLIIDYLEIPKEYYETTRYYYNYVDLNEDGVQEIFVVVMGPYTSGTGGSTALWVVERDGKLHVNQDFTLVNTPVIVSDKRTNGARDLIIPYYGGGAESQYSVITCSDGYYQKVSDGTMIKTLDGVYGNAIIANDLLKEVESGFMGLNLLSK